MTARPTLLASYWMEEVTRARRQQHIAETVAERLTSAPTANVFIPELQRARRHAVLLYAEAWGQYAADAERCFQDAAIAEMEAADAAEARP